jgi:hypothetical protein
MGSSLEIMNVDKTALTNEEMSIFLLVFHRKRTNVWPFTCCEAGGIEYSGSESNHSTTVWAQLCLSSCYRHYTRGGEGPYTLLLALDNAISSKPKGLRLFCISFRPLLLKCREPS